MTQPSPALPSATILMLRDDPEGMEVFMVVRHHEIDFASGALVFPGGKADAADFDPALRQRVDGAAEAPDMLAIQIAAIREAFEECGVLLARVNGEDALIDAARLAPLEPYRQKLNDHEISIGEFLADHDLRLAADQLVHFAHWVTPEMLPKRFDTHFYLAVAPADHLAIHDGTESVDSVWIRPADAVRDAAAGKYTIIFPTLRNVEKLAQSDSIDAALAAARTSDVVRVLPWMDKRDDGTYLCIPPEAGYPISEEKMPARPGGPA
jgi:8-oxo-dGTP pyrophosphatase MutT (NUDIX family)